MRLNGLIAFLCLATSPAFAGLFGPSLVLANPVAAAPANDPVFASLTHVWHLEEASGNARVDSVGSAALSEALGTVPSASGKHGNCADFTSTTHVLITAANFVSTPPYSIAFWVKVHDRVAASSGPWVNLYGGDPAVGVTMNSDASPYPVEASFAGNGGGYGASSLTTLDAWHLIIIVVDGDGLMHQSLDNEPLLELSGSPPDDIGPLQIGQGAPMGLSLDEPMIFSAALTQANVTTLWNSGAGLFPTP